MYSAIIEKYEAAALENSLSLSELAVKANVAPSTFTRWRGGVKPQGRTLRKLDRALAEMTRAPISEPAK